MIIVTVGARTCLHPVDCIPGAVMARIREKLSIDNPAWLENRKRGRWNGQTPKTLCYFTETPEGLIVPRGFTRQLLDILSGAGIQYSTDDQRRALPEVGFAFKGKLRDYQESAVKAMLGRDFGVLSAPTGSGKTVIGLYLVAARRQPALIVVHTKDLLFQWIERIEAFLGIPAVDVGMIGDGKRRIGERITVALVQSLCKCADEITPVIGHLVVDEAHHCPASTFSEVVSRFDAKYVTGLSATLERRDGLSRVIYFYLGDAGYEIPAKGLQNDGSILKPEVIIRETHFIPSVDPSEDYSRMITELCEDRERNNLIVADVIRELHRGVGVCLVLSDRKNHCRALQRMLQQQGISTALLVGDLSATERQKTVNDINTGNVKVLIATGQLVGEGFDCKVLSSLFLVTPIRFRGRLVQYIGRILRPAPGKGRARVFDYVDPVGVLKNAGRERMRVYRKG